MAVPRSDDILVAYVECTNIGFDKRLLDIPAFLTRDRGSQTLYAKEVKKVEVLDGDAVAVHEFLALALIPPSHIRVVARDPAPPADVLRPTAGARLQHSSRGARALAAHRQVLRVAEVPDLAVPADALSELV